MSISTRSLKKVTQDFRSGCLESRSKKPSIDIVDQYDLRYIGKQIAKKLTMQELDALIVYGTTYIKEYKSGKYMTRKSRGAVVADFDEAEALQQITNSVAVMTAESQRRL